MRILVTDGMDKTAMAQLRDMGHEVVEQFYEPEELGAALRDFDAVVVRSKTKVRKNHIDEAKGGKLRLIIRGGVGVDNIDVDYARSCGIAVRNTPGASSASVAELALAHMFACARYISIAGHTMREDKWEKKALAEEIKQKLDACEGDLTALTALFRELADEYSEDPGRETYPTGYTFTTGAMVPEFEAAAYALAEGAVSEIVESSFGYHILLRLPLDKAAAADAVRETYFTDFFSDRVESAVIATSAEFDKLDPQVLYETIQAAAQVEG